MWSGIQAPQKPESVKVREKNCLVHIYMSICDKRTGGKWNKAASFELSKPKVSCTLACSCHDMLLESYAH